MNTSVISFAIGILTWGLGSPPAVAELQLRQTPQGVHFGISAEKQAQPAPTLLIIGNPITMLGQENMRYLLATGEVLAQHGWIYVALDPACEGHDLKEGQPASLGGWAIHAKRGEDFITPYVRNCVEVLDHLVASGITDVQRIAVQGISRGGFCALHFAAREPRIRAVLGMSPVTNPLALKEFETVAADQIAGISLDHTWAPLAGRPVWISIGNSDDRVSTDECIAFTRRLITTTHALQPRLNLFPVHLHIGVSAGHRTPDDAYSAAADFLLKTFPSPNQR